MEDRIMTPEQRRSIAKDFQISVLRLRDDAKRLADEARQRGDEKEARAFERQLPKLDKMIIKFGLAHRAPAIS